MKNIKLLFSITITSLLLFGCNSEDYANAIDKINQEKWEEAILIFEELPINYKDVAVLYNFAEANLKLNNFEPRDINSDYLDILDLLEKTKNYNYDGEFKSSIAELYTTVLELQTNRENEQPLLYFREAISLIGINEFDKALEEVSKIKIENPEDIETINNYINARIYLNKFRNSQSFKDEKVYYDYILAIGPNYNGSFSEEIYKFIHTKYGKNNTPHGKEEIWENIQFYADLNKQRVKTESALKRYQSNEPRIGMTAEEARNSNWGTPRDINKTTTAYGTSEQWVYFGYKYIYLDDGIVTAIQE